LFSCNVQPQLIYRNYEIILLQIKAFAEQHDIDLNNYFVSQEETIANVKNTLSEIRGAFENNRFSVAMHFTDNDILNAD